MYKKKRWNIKNYAPNWKQQSLACRLLAGNKCEVCGIAQGTELVSKRTGNIYKVFLSACHLNMFDEMNLQAELCCMCISCHATYDSMYHNLQKSIKIRALQMKLALFPEEEYETLEQEYREQLATRKVTRIDFLNKQRKVA